MTNPKSRPGHYLRVAAASPEVKVADTDFNFKKISSEYIRNCEEHNPDVVLFPELCITGYTCGDLFRQPLLLESAQQKLAELAYLTSGHHAAMIVGLPIVYGSKLLNVAAVCCGGSVMGIVPKQYLPDYNEFYEKRRFSSGMGIANEVVILDSGECVPIGTDLIFEIAGVKTGIEICEDLWTPPPPSTKLCLNGVEVIFNLSATNELIGKHQYLVSLIRQQSARCICGYAYASAGRGESSTDLVYTGNAIIAENGIILQEAKRFSEPPLTAVADIDIDILRSDRLNSTFRDCSKLADSFGKIICSNALSNPTGLLRNVDAHPFVPDSGIRLKERCEEITSIQSAGLEQRLRHTGATKIVVGISGGLDSTLALLIAVKAFDNLGLDRSGIVGITMPGFGTTGRTLGNANILMQTLGVTSLCIPIAKAVEQHFADIEQDPETHDVAYENSQARERTQILMDYANKIGTMVLGTGDLSELALGWCTYNGDHMSMYAVNVSIPKTLVKHLVGYFADTTENQELKRALTDIIDTPISPELIPGSDKDEIAQKTEDLVGPYELHDFFLYHLLRYASEPAKIYMLACLAFEGAYSKETIKHWLKTFYRRFFNQQFKRSCMPDGPKVGSACLSPRGDWRMPSDASSQLWLKEIDKLD